MTFVKATLILAALIALSQAQIVEYLKAGHKCNREMGMDRKLGDKIVKGLKVPKTEKTQCYVLCLYQTFGIIDQDGEFLPEIAAKKVPKPLARFQTLADDWVEHCKGETAEDKCEKAYKIWECFVKLKDQSTAEILKKLRQ